MSPKMKSLFRILLLVALFSGLMIGLMITEKAELWVRVLVCGVLCGLYGVGRKYIDNK